MKTGSIWIHRKMEHFLAPKVTQSALLRSNARVSTVSVFRWMDYTANVLSILINYKTRHFFQRTIMEYYPVFNWNGINFISNWSSITNEKYVLPVPIKISWWYYTNDTVPKSKKPYYFLVSKQKEIMPDMSEKKYRFTDVQGVSSTYGTIICFKNWNKFYYPQLAQLLQRNLENFALALFTRLYSHICI